MGVGRSASKGGDRVGRACAVSLSHGRGSGACLTPSSGIGEGSPALRSSPTPRCFSSDAGGALAGRTAVAAAAGSSSSSCSTTASSGAGDCGGWRVTSAIARDRVSGLQYCNMAPFNDPHDYWSELRLLLDLPPLLVFEAELHVALGWKG